MPKTSSQPQDKYVLRLPDGMRDRIKAAADASGRSMNAEIVLRLENSFDTLPTAAELTKLLDENFSDREWANAARVELQKPQPDIRRVVDFLDLLGVDVIAGMRGKTIQAISES